jgi:phenylacetate-CoA ligase
MSPQEIAKKILPDAIMLPKTIADVTTLPPFIEALRAAEYTLRIPFDAMPSEFQQAIIARRLRQLVEICRINPLWRARIDGATPHGRELEKNNFQNVPCTDKETFRKMFTGLRPGMVVPIDHCGFEIVASGGTSSGQPSETVYPLGELQETYAWAGNFIGKHLIARFMPEPGAKWVVTTLADDQMWSSGTMVGGVLQKIPGINYIGAGPINREVFQLMMAYPGPKTIMGVSETIAQLSNYADGLSPSARASFRIALYGSGPLSPDARAELLSKYPNLLILSYFAATEAETVGLQLDPNSQIFTAVPGLHLIEVVDNQGRALAEDCEGDLVVTRLFGNTAPCLRYKVGDRVIRRRDYKSGTLNAFQFEYVGRSADSQAN